MAFDGNLLENFWQHHYVSWLSNTCPFSLPIIFNKTFCEKNSLFKKMKIKKKTLEKINFFPRVKLSFINYKVIIFVQNKDV